MDLFSCIGLEIVCDILNLTIDIPQLGVSKYFCILVTLLIYYYQKG